MAWRNRWNNDYNWRPYVPVARRKAQAAAALAKLAGKGGAVQPVTVKGRKIAATFWGQAWCGHLEKFSDYSNRLPRGRSYARNGAVCHLEINKGEIQAMVSGSRLYKVSVKIKPLPSEKWARLKARCAGRIGSALELLRGSLSGEVMGFVCDRDNGLFPAPKEIELGCTCPDWATMCKHVAAALYGVGARLDERPELLFLLRGVDHLELVAAGTAMNLAAGSAAAEGRVLAGGNLSAVFGIDVDDSAPVAVAKGPGLPPAPPAPPKRGVKAARRKPARKPAGKKPGRKPPHKPAGKNTPRKPAGKPVRKPGSKPAGPRPDHQKKHARRKE